ncbi:MAG: 3-phosphoshikimate 1-carboxyvinyltransferase [Parachlamydiales bacterium]|jgi:3-phosphoshikimate 1-carboxyvinyltransferase
MKIQLKGLQPFSGKLTIPPSKSQTMRAFIFALLAEGESTIFNPLISPDTLAMLEAIESLGAKRMFQSPQKITLLGTGGQLKAPTKTIDAHNSGLILRLIGALLGYLKTPAVITGDLSIQKNRSVAPLISGLKQLGAQVTGLGKDPRPPLLIQGPIHPGKMSIFGEDSQPVSAFLIALAFLNGPSEILVKKPKEKPWIDLTLSWLDFFQIPYERKGYAYYKLFGGGKIRGFEYRVPADFSSLSYPAALALLTGGHLLIEGLSFQDRQGDKLFLHLLQKMGADLLLNEEKGALEIRPTSRLKALEIDAGDLIDAVPLLALIATFAKGTTCIYNAQNARIKESDRLKTITLELRKMGARIEEKQGSLVIFSSPLHEARLFSHLDHRIALSLIVAGLSVKGVSVLENAECLKKSYPNFLEELKNHNQNIKIL